MSEISQAILTAILASSGVWSVVLYLIQRHDRKRQDKDAETAARLTAAETKIRDLSEENGRQSRALVAQMHHELYQDCTRILQEYQDGARSSIDVDEMHDIGVMYEAYAALGGNGTCKVLYEKLKSLPPRQTNNP